MCSIVKFLNIANTFFHIFLGSQEDWSPLMNAFWLNVKDWPMAGACHSARILHDEGHWVALVEEAKLSIRCILCHGILVKFTIFLESTARCWVHENATVKQSPMHIGHHGADIALAVG